MNDKQSILFQRALSFYKNKNLTKSEELLQIILKTHPNHIDTLNLLGAIKLKLSQTNQGIELFNKILKICPNNCEALNNLGYAYLSIQEPQAAIDYFKKSINARPNFIDSYLNLVNAYLSIADYKSVIYYCKQTIELKPKLSRAYLIMGLAHYELGESQIAIDNYRIALSIDQQDAEAYNNLGVALQQIKDFDGALEAYTMAIKINPSYASAYNNLGSLFRERKNIVSAFENFAYALQHDRDCVDAILNIATLHIEQETDIDLAESLALKAIEIKPQNPLAYQTLGLARHLKGDFYGALAQFEKSTNIKSGSIQISNYIGDILLEMGKLEVADKILTSILNNAVSIYSFEKILFQSNDRYFYVALIARIMIIHWIRARFEDLDLIIDKLPAFNKLPQSSENKNLLAYIKFITLLSANKTNKCFYPTGKLVLPEIVVIGESHSLSIANTLISINNHTYKVTAMLSIGLKMWHLYKDGYSYRKIALENKILNIPNSVPIILMIGEIDCRPNEGIWKASKKLGMCPLELARHTVRNYLEWCHGLSLSSRKLIIQGIPAPAYSLNELEESEQAKFLDMIDIVNQILRDTSKANGWRFIDVYGATVNSRKTNNVYWMIDEFHVKPDFYQQSNLFEI